MDRIIWKNGKLLPESEATISIYDSALMFGDSVFEMTRSFNGKHFLLQEHIDRLYRSAKPLKIEIPLTPQELSAVCQEVSDANKFEPDDEHRLLINVSRGALGIYHGTGAHRGTNIIVSDFPLRWTVAGMGRLFDEGVNAVIPSQRAIPSDLIDARVKHRSRLHFMKANIEVAQMKGDNNWALLLDTDGYIAEGTGANFFIVKDEVLYTPEPRNILKGITRRYVIDWGNLIGCTERNLLPYDVFNADEAFFTGTPFCIMPVTSLNGQKIGTDNPVTKSLIEAWSWDVGVDIVEQIKAWDKGAVEGATPYKF